jgi:hypothetical protein
MLVGEKRGNFAASGIAETVGIFAFCLWLIEFTKIVFED